MKYMAAVVALAAVAIAAPVEVEKRDDECPDATTVACCDRPVGFGVSLICDVSPLASECLAIPYCCNNKGDDGLIDVDLFQCEPLLRIPVL